jgi:hypothetical protein
MKHLHCLLATLTLTFSVPLTATPITVQNHSFETATLPILVSDAYMNNLFTLTGTTAHWTAVGPNNNTAYGGSFQQFITGMFPNWTDPNPWWSGQNVGYLFPFGNTGPIALQQVLSDTLADDTTYDLGVLVGRRTFDWGGPGFFYDVQLLAGGNLLASGNALALAVDSWGQHSLSYNSGSSNPFSGQALSIRLVANQNEVYFDDVTLNATSNVPEPSSMAVMALGLGVVAYRLRLRGRRRA